MSAAERVHAVPELRRRILQYLDKPVLCAVLRSGPRLFATGTLILYRSITHDVAQAIQPGPREEAYLSAVREIDASDAALKINWTSAQVQQFMHHEHLDHVLARFPNIHKMRRVPPPYHHAAWRINFRRKHIRMQTAFRPTSQEPAPPPLDASRWKGWAVEQTFAVDPWSMPGELDRKRLLRLFQHADLRDTVTYADVNVTRITLSELADICRVSTALHTIYSLQLQPFTLDEWCDFIATAGNMRYLHLEALDHPTREEVEPMLPQMVEEAKRLRSLRVLDFRLQVLKDEDLYSRVTLHLRVARDRHGEVQTWLIDNDGVETPYCPP